MAGRNCSLLELERETRNRPGQKGTAYKAARASSLSGLQDQIDAVAGRKCPAPSSALRRLEEGLLGRQRGRTYVVSRSYDSNIPVDITYAHPHVLARDESLALTRGGDLGAGPYTVESFEDMPPPTGDLASPERPVPSEPGQSRSQLAGPSSPIKELEETAECAPTDKIALGSALDTTVDDFEAEIMAILNGQGDRPPAASQSSEVGAPDEPAQEEATVEDTHAIFDQMGRDMRYATTFDLGAVELGRRFDSFERELDKTETLRSPSHRSPLNLPARLDDMDVLAELVEMSGSSPKPEAQSVEGKAPATLIPSQPSPAEGEDQYLEDIVGPY